LLQFGAEFFVFQFAMQKHKDKTQRTVILLLVLYGCEAWSLTLRVEHRLMVYKDRVLREVFGPNGDKVTGELRRLHSKELYALYFSPNISQIIKSRRTRWAVHVTHKGDR
jgi:hypothetical protein